MTGSVEKQHPAGGPDRQGGDVRLLVGEEGRRAEEVPGGKLADRQRPLGHRDAAPEDEAQLPAKALRGVDDLPALILPDFGPGPRKEPFNVPGGHALEEKGPGEHLNPGIVCHFNTPQKCLI